MREDNLVFIGVVLFFENLASNECFLCMINANRVTEIRYSYKKKSELFLFFVYRMIFKCARDKTI